VFDLYKPKYISTEGLETLHICNTHQNTLPTSNILKHECKINTAGCASIFEINQKSEKNQIKNNQN